MLAGHPAVTLRAGCPCSCIDYLAFLLLKDYLYKTKTYKNIFVFFVVSEFALLTRDSDRIR
jgi:hypothetical protein